MFFFFTVVHEKVTSPHYRDVKFEVFSAPSTLPEYKELEFISTFKVPQFFQCMTVECGVASISCSTVVMVIALLPVVFLRVSPQVPSLSF